METHPRFGRAVGEHDGRFGAGGWLWYIGGVLVLAGVMNSAQGVMGFFAHAPDALSKVGLGLGAGVAGALILLVAIVRWRQKVVVFERGLVHTRLIGTREIGERYGLRPRARIVSAAVSGSEPTIMLTGPAPATRKALARAGLTIDDIDLVEINEAFAAVVLRFVKDMGLSLDKVNVNGGAIALGHPLGATGAMILGTLVDELERQDKRYGLATLCVGGGMGIATIVERV